MEVCTIVGTEDLGSVYTISGLKTLEVYTIFGSGTLEVYTTFGSENLGVVYYCRIHHPRRRFGGVWGAKPPQLAGGFGGPQARQRSVR